MPSTNVLKEAIAQLKALTSEEKRNILFISLCFFFTLFSYPIIRSTTGAIFLNSVGATKSPLVWVYSIVALSGVITLYNIFQVKYTIHKLFSVTVAFTLVFFGICLALYMQGNTAIAYPLYIWKEVYIVLMIHMCFGYFNTCITVDMAKILYGPLGAIGSIGGIIGGILTHQLSYAINSEQILLVGLGFILAGGVCFWFTDHSITLGDSANKSDPAETQKPLDSILPVKKYVFYLALIIALSQFCIGLANFKFYVIFSDLVPDKILKTRYQGVLYSSINAISLFIQFFVIPLAFKFFKDRTIHLFIPKFYLIISTIGFIFAGNLLIPVAATFAMFKGVDYSIFSAAKEILYFPLKKPQRYGAKYIVDIVVYRFGKGLISFLLIYIQGPNIINGLLIFFLICWGISVIPLFKEATRIKALES